MDFQQLQKLVPASLLSFLHAENFQHHMTHYNTLRKWQAIVQLVSNNTLPDYWARHMVDSVQLLPFLAPHDCIIDIGSGGGFPAITCAIEHNNSSEKQFHLIESQNKKCAFLSEVVRLTGVNAHVHCLRIENNMNVPRGTFSAKSLAITARALADMNDLLGYAHILANGKTDYVCYFLKSNNVNEELTRAQEWWTFDYVVHPSLTDSRGCIVEVKSIQPL